MLVCLLIIANKVCIIVFSHYSVNVFVVMVTSLARGLLAVGVWVPISLTVDYG